MAGPEANALLPLLEECLEQIDAHGPAALDRLCAAHPAVAAELRRHVGALEQFGLLAAPPERIPKQLGDFRLIEPLGSGGMGVVYLAEQLSLKRQVALKLVRPEHLFFPGTRARFAREVETIAQLQHPAIVPIHSVGEEEGIPYFAMELVDGATLAAVLEALAGRPPATLTGADLAHAVEQLAPSRVAAAPRKAEQSYLFAGSHVDACLRIVRQLADALAHAHERGVLHRDLKSTNVMVTPGGRVILLDFGLASRERASRLTKSGSFVGSLPYMPPERLRGDPELADARADLYSLGVLLYELLCLRLPFPQTKLDQLRDAILAGGPPPLRRLNPAVPRDVETLCLTAMERDPRRRYASAADLARDVDNVLARRPIEARRAGSLVKLARWGQRNPGGAAAAGLALLVAVGGPIGYALFERDARRDVEAEQSRTLAQRVRAEGNFRRVLDAVAKLLEPLLQERADEIPEMERVRRDVLERALAVYEGFDAEEAADPELRRDLASASVQRGHIDSILRKSAGAAANFERAVAELEQLRGQEPADPKLSLQLGSALLRQGAQAAATRAAEAETHFRRAIAAFESIPAGDPLALEARKGIADSRANLASSLSAQHRSAEAEAEAQKAIVIATALVAQDAADLVSLEELAHARFRLGEVLIFTAGGARRDEGVAELEKGRVHYEELVRRNGGGRSSRYQLAQVHLRMARAHDLGGRTDAGAASLEQAQKILEELVARFPEVTGYASELGDACSNLGYFRLAQGRVDEAQALLVKACTLLRAAARGDAGNSMRPVLLAMALARLGDAERRRGDLPASLAAWDEALVEGARKLEPEPPWFAPTVRSWKWDRLDALIATGDLDGAAEQADALVDEQEPGAESHSRAALVFARCAARAADSDELDEEERARRAEGFETDAAEHLAEAVARGFKPASAWLADPALARLTQQESVRERIAGLGIAAPGPSR